MKRLSIWGWPLWWPLAVGLLSLAVTAWLWQHEQQTQQRHLRDNFDFGLRQTTTRIEQRLVSYEQMLRGVRGLFEASDEITAADFAGYVDALLAGADFAGLRNIAYAPLLGGDGPAPVVHVAPATEGGLNPPGRDLWADPGSRSAMQQARNSGRVAITRRLRPPDGAADEAGFLMFMPLYQRGRSVATAVERQAHGAGWVMASFRLGDLMSSLYGEDTPGMAVSIHDGVELSARTLIHLPVTARSGEVVDAGEYRLRCKDGADRLVEVRLVMIGDREHDVLGAAVHGVPTIGVLHGMGSRDELEAAGARWVAADLLALPELLARIDDESAP